jgi:phosphoribosylformylglycinamidine (FGAM) synthase-like enzyme
LVFCFVDYELPWEDPSLQYPYNFASPLEVLIEASNGASDYGNKFGEPVISGFARSFGLLEPSGDRREWIKPIMFSGGVGSLDENMVKKLKPEKGIYYNRYVIFLTLPYYLFCILNLLLSLSDLSGYIFC